jgi:phenylalanyl-tRNA synthetase beta subunit
MQAIKEVRAAQQGDLMVLEKLTSEQRRALLKFFKYAIKRAEMSRHYAEARDSAVDEFSSYASNPTVQRMYEFAWSSMVKHYDEAITDPNIIRRVIRNYARAMFGIELSEREIDELLEEMGMILYRR